MASSQSAENARPASHSILTTVLIPAPVNRAVERMEFRYAREIRSASPKSMSPWFWYAVVAAVFYGAHQILTAWRPTISATGSAASCWKERLLSRSFSTSHFSTSPDAGTKSSPTRAFGILRYRASVLALALSLSSCSFKRRSVVIGAGHSRGRCRNHGGRGNPFLSRASFLAAASRYRDGDRRTFPASEIIPISN